ncbi:MAG TPA: metallophosphoesterase [Burkholderiaceae bacterium]|nr:metallophosphoesterase [Burkholderiaceae bacterium]
MPFTIPRRLAALAAPLLLAACAAVPPSGAGTPFTSFVVLGEDGAAVARVLTQAPTCPAIVLDGVARPMTLRAAPATIAQRPTVSPPELSKPSVFDVRTCEAALPAGLAGASVLGQPLPLPHADPQRIVVLGDTGCRLLKKEDSFQACNDATQYPFATVAALAAAWHPDLVIHVGDYHYRENACPPGNDGCAGSPWGYGWDAWQADLFRPGAALLRAAPWVVTRGNHESCARAGQGWWRFLDPRPLLAGRDCNRAADDDLGDYSDPYAVPLGADSQLLVFDTASTTWRGFQPGDAGLAHYRDNYVKLAALARRARHNIGVDHHPLLGIGADLKDDGKLRLLLGDAGLVQSFGAINPLLLPDNMDLMLSGHVHLWQQVSFTSAHPSQFISGFSGTAEDIVPIPDPLPPGTSPVPGAVIEQLSAWIDGFGFMTMEGRGADRWEVQVHDLQGAVRNTCQVQGRRSVCEHTRVR